MSWVVTSAASSGEVEDIRIHITMPDSIKEAMVDGTESYMFVTYDSASRVRVESGGFTILSQRTRTVDSATGKQQTAVLLRAPDFDGTISDLVLLLVLGPTDPISWRQTTVVMLGEHVSSILVDYTTTADTPQPTDPEGGTPASLLFFGHESKVITISNDATPVVSIDDEGSKIDVFTWGTAVLNGVTGGPWFTARVTATVPLPPEPPYVRPPPVDADTFWAYPACCECGDFFIINNDKLAETWDVEGSTALDQGDSVMFNYTDEEGTRWSLTDVENWWTLPPLTLPDLPNSGYLDGSFPVDGRYNARFFKVSGSFWPGPDVSAAVPRQRLLRALDAVRGGALWVAKEPVWAKQSWVYLADQPTIVTRKPSRLTTFEFTLKAVDPIKYHAGTAGFQEVTLVEASSGYKRRTYSRETIPVASTGGFVWSAATAVAAPADGQMSSTGAFFDDTVQTVCVSGKDGAGVAVDLSGMKSGYPFAIQVGAHRLDAVVTRVTNNSTWWAVEVGKAPTGSSTHSKPTAGEQAVSTWYLPGSVYTDEAVLRGMRFRPEPANNTELQYAPNPYRRYQTEPVEPSTVTVINAGTTKVMPRVYVYGQCSNPVVVNHTTGQRMQFVGNVMQGEVLVADCYWRVVSIRPDTTGPSLDPRGDLEGQNRRWMVDFTTDWLSVVPGENVFTMSASSLSPTARVTIAFRSGWLG
jgi:Phage tail protein